MTPQLRQAIKLLQLSNLEVAAFVEEEMERNPLLELDERAETASEVPALDQRETPAAPGTDTADQISADTLPAADKAPLDTEFDGYEAFGPADGMRIPDGAGGHAFEADDRGLEDILETKPDLRSHLGEQLRLNITGRLDQLIGATLIALLAPSGRLGADPADIARALGADLARVEAVRARMMRFDPCGLFARDLRECLAAQLARTQPARPGDAGAARQSGTAGQARPRAG